MKIVVTGTRGFPSIQGGVETHCEELYTRLARFEGIDVTVVRRKGYLTAASPASFKGVSFKDIDVPSFNGVESALHTIYATLYARRVRADILHVHGVGPSVVVPLARILGLKVVMTHHGADYERTKWGFFARIIIRSGERFAALYAQRIIAISPIITDLLKRKYGRVDNVSLIYNGVNLPSADSVQSTAYLDALGVLPGRYVLAVGRFVKEKNFDRLIDCFTSMNTGMDLVIAGDADIETPYSRDLKAKARNTPRVRLTGMIKGEKLSTLYAHAALFVLPSSHEGLPITVLEAMSYRRKTVVSDIDANLALGLDASSYFRLGDKTDMAGKMLYQLGRAEGEEAYDLSAYNWDSIAAATLGVYDSLSDRIKRQ
ncbi:MAG: glycosyltransferase family 4 protein [Tannerellaceae bacterium]|jgi:glycosyltransferase involved in cell wall biosynthesis|nr:glycosyltransferase family 4 protein [Tannerellaceae bacterium]